jgi:hypothetical protein
LGTWKTTKSKDGVEYPRHLANRVCVIIRKVHELRNFIEEEIGSVDEWIIHGEFVRVKLEHSVQLLVRNFNPGSVMGEKRS